MKFSTDQPLVKLLESKFKKGLERNLTLKVTTSAVIKFPMTTATRASFHESPIAIKELPILQLETAKTSEIQYMTTVWGIG